MPTREQLHGLLDFLPEQAIEAAYRVLSQFQTWPPPAIEELRLKYEQRLKEIQEAGSGEIGTIGIGGGSMELQDPTERLRSGYWSFDHLDGDTLVVETHRYKDGHELSIVERICIQGEHLIYKHEITGPVVSGTNEISSLIFRSVKISANQKTKERKVGMSDK